MKTVFISVLVILLLASCKRSNEKIVGPSICPSESFETVNALVHPVSVNLNTTNATFNAQFNEVVDWSLTIRGTVSQSVKRFSGSSKMIQQTWYGEPDTALFFKAELCEVSLKIACREAIKSSLTITQPSGFANMPNTFLVTNMEGGGSSTIGGPYGDGENDITFGGLIPAPTDPSPQGGGYYYFDCDSINPSYYFGGIYTNGAISLPATWTDPKQVYLNMFLNSDGFKNSDVQILCPGAGGVSYRKTMNWTGWKLLAFPLSEMEIQNPTSVSSLDFGLGSAPNKEKSASMKLDFIIFTYGKPFYKETF
ncbi:MAG: hypothetical protein MUF42_02370 [Cytophagaceae bacterium]|jgi:hypothetical protein|nr:hypothetical protein [Cytophagaceae bacterium]